MDAVRKGTLRESSGTFRDGSLPRSSDTLRDGLRGPLETLRLGLAERFRGGMIQTAVMPSEQVGAEGLTALGPPVAA